MENTNKYTYKVTWKSTVPFKVWLTFGTDWKEGVSLSNKEKKEILKAGVQECENWSFLWVPCAEDLEDVGEGWRVEFKGLKVKKRPEYNDELTFASREVTGKIVYSGEYYLTEYNRRDDKQEIQKRVMEAAENASRCAYNWLGEQHTGFRLEKENGFEDFPGIDKLDEKEGGWVAITGGTNYGNCGWGEWFNFPAENGNLKAIVTREVRKEVVNA